MRHHILRRILREIGQTHLYIEMRNGTKFTDVEVILAEDGAVIIEITPTSGMTVDEEDIVLIRTIAPEKPPYEAK